MAVKKRSDELTVPRRDHDSTATRVRDCDRYIKGDRDGDHDGDHQRKGTESNSGNLAARPVNGAGRKLRKKDTARKRNGAGTGDFERARAHKNGTVSVCTLVTITLSRAGSANDVNKLPRAGRAQFNALGDVMRAVLGICASACDARVRMRVRLANCFCTVERARFRNLMKWRATRVQHEDAV